MRLSWLRPPPSSLNRQRFAHEFGFALRLCLPFRGRPGRCIGCGRTVPEIVLGGRCSLGLARSYRRTLSGGLTGHTAQRDLQRSLRRRRKASSVIRSCTPRSGRWARFRVLISWPGLAPPPSQACLGARRLRLNRSDRGERRLSAKAALTRHLLRSLKGEQHVDGDGADQTRGAPRLGLVILGVARSWMKPARARSDRGACIKWASGLLRRRPQRAERGSR